MKQIQLTYHEESGYLYPDLTLPEQTHHPIGKYLHQLQNLEQESKKLLARKKMPCGTDNIR